MAFDGTWSMFFNENMMTNLNLDMPYQHVYDNTWTIDTLIEYTKAAANLNGDETFVWRPEGKAVYGMSIHSVTPIKMILSAGEKFVKPNADGIPEYAIDNERFYDVYEKLTSFMLNTAGMSYHGSNVDFDAQAGGYDYIFANERSLFLTAEIKTAQLLRDVEFTFGIVPFPKFTSEQESYYSAVVSNLFVFTIPITNPDTSFAATIADVMSYESHKNILPIYFDITVAQKGLRNQESINMFDIIKDSRDFDLGDIYSFTSNLMSTVNTKVIAANTDIASDVAKAQAAVEENIRIMVDRMS
jgi:hypothetical protein